MFRTNCKKCMGWGFVVILCLSFPSSVYANSSWQQKAELTAVDGNTDDWFGFSVSISDDFAIVGTPYDDDKGNNSGSAYIFKKSSEPDDPNWYQQVKLTASDANNDDWFGWSVGISENFAIVGAYYNDSNGSNSGSAYIFKQSDDANDPNWYQQVKLLAADTTTGDFFGHSVAICGDYAIIGAPGDDDNGLSSGSAYIFKRSSDPNDPNWYEQDKVIALYGGVHENFGYSVSIDEDYCIVGTPFDDAKKGSAYIFKREDEDWIRHFILQASDRTNEDRFGMAVSISGDYCIVTAPYDDDNGSDSGSAYIFERGGLTWYQRDKITAFDGATKDFFGLSASLFDNIAVVGSPCDDDNEPNSGSVYIFKQSIFPGDLNWYHQDKLTASDGTDGDRFGYSVSISNGYCLAGAILASANDVNCGSTYMFKRLMPSGDLDEDYCVNWHDVNILTEQWLEPMQAKLTAPDGANYDWFGLSASIDSNFAVAGSPSDDPSGSAYIFKRDGRHWTHQQKLTAPDAGSDASLGSAVSIDDDFIIIGAHQDDQNGYMSGSAYIFKRSNDTNYPNWYQQDKLLASDGAPYQTFGRSVSLCANYAVVGAPQSAYIFKQSNDINDPNWYQQTKIITPDSNNTYSDFGRTVSISGDYLIIGDSGDDENGPFSGSAFMYKRSSDANDPNWYLQKKLLAPDGNDYDYFGYSVSISGDYCLVGAYGDEPNGYRSGSAYIFKRSSDANDPNWYLQAKLIASDSAESDMFGQHVSIRADYCIVGAYANDDYGTNSGSAYIFKRINDTWIEVYKIVPRDGAAMDFFGRCVSISDNYAIIGAHYDDNKGPDSGSAYIFNKDYPTADLNNDYYVDFLDYAILAQYWLQCN